MAIELSAWKFCLLAAVSVSLAACESSSGATSDTASVVGTISRGGTTDSGGVGASPSVGSAAVGGSTSAGSTSGASTSGASTSGGAAPGGSTSGGSTSGGATGSGGTSGTATKVGSTTASSIAGGSLAKAPPTVEKSIAGWVNCDATADATDGVARALAAARHSAFTLVVDCPLRLHFGDDITRSLFIDSGTNVTFTGSGKFTVDNVFIPAFVIANSDDIVLTNWNVEYDAGLPVNPKTGGYESAGQFVASTASAPAGGAFNDVTLTRWLTANRAVAFDSKQGHVASSWAGPANAMAVFYITGDTSNVTVTGMRVYAPPSAGADQFVPTVFSLSENYKSSQTVTAATPQTAEHLAVPHNLTFSGIDFDGTYMGWLGGTQNAVFDKIRSHRYGDLQDAKGGNVGGVGKWFSPPHLFYLNYQVAGDPGLFTKNVQIHDVVDSGLRVGTARDKGGTDSLSGYALSLKLGCVDCSVDTYTSSRPDGFMDVLSSNGLTVSNATATYDSAFINNLYYGLRFPQMPYKDITLDNVSVTDTAALSVRLPVGTVGQPSNENIVFKNVRTVMNRWGGAGLPLPIIEGSSNSISMDVSILGSDARVAMASLRGLQMTLQVAPANLKVGGTTTLKWVASGATSCSANGAWSGLMPTGGSRVVTAGPAGSYDYVFYCQNPGSSSSAALPVVVKD